MRYTPSKKLLASCLATWSAIRVFPEPPAPDKVTSGVVARSRRTALISCSRPMKLVSSTGKLWGGAPTSRCGAFSFCCRFAPSCRAGPLRGCLSAARCTSVASRSRAMRISAGCRISISARSQRATVFRATPRASANSAWLKCSRVRCSRKSVGNMTPSPAWPLYATYQRTRCARCRTAEETRLCQSVDSTASFSAHVQPRVDSLILLC